MAEPNDPEPVPCDRCIPRYGDVRFSCSNVPGNLRCATCVDAHQTCNRAERTRDVRKVLVLRRFIRLGENPVVDKSCADERTKLQDHMSRILRHRQNARRRERNQNARNERNERRRSRNSPLASSEGIVLPIIKKEPSRGEILERRNQQPASASRKRRSTPHPRPLVVVPPPTNEHLYKPLPYNALATPEPSTPVLASSPYRALFSSPFPPSPGFPADI